MKKIFILLLCVAVCSALLLSATSCDIALTDPDAQKDPADSEEQEEKENSEEQSGEQDPKKESEAEHDPSLLYLWEKGKSGYSLVFAAEVNRSVVSESKTMVKALKEKGFSCENGITESESTGDMEIIIGTQSTREGCNVDPYSLGENGWTVKCVGNRIVIAGGTPDATAEALKAFYSALTVGENTVTLPKNYSKTYTPTYTLKDVRICGISIAEYTVVCEGNSELLTNCAYSFRNRLYETTGIWIPVTYSSSGVVHDITFRSVADAGETGFRVVCQDGRMIVESAYISVFDKNYQSFEDEFFSKTGTAEYDNDYCHTERANILYYSDFGAVGDGVTDDFDAIYATHEAANIGGQKVMGDAGMTYYIGQTSKAVSIRTDTDWTGATFIIDDTVVDLDHRSKNIFQVKSSYATTKVASELLEGLTLKKGQTNIGLTFDSDCMIYVTWSAHKVYIRYGLNENNGSTQAEMFLVDKDGNIDSSTPVAWDYDQIDSVTVYSLQDTPITVEGGTFITKANNQARAYTYYSRNIIVSRPHTTLKNIVHLVEDEGDSGAPYSGFFGANQAYDVTFENLTVTGHKTYKLATDERVSMGSYDTDAAKSVNILWKNCSQSNSITDTTKWGVHASNFCKDLHVEGCSFSRFDAHQGMYNVTITDTVLGFALNCIGGGRLYCENVTRLRNNAFITLRSDYGSTWDGDVVLKDCTLEAYSNEACTSRNSTGYVFNGSYTAGWNFGYTCYMPQNVTLDNFKFNGTGTLYVFWKVSASAATDTVNPYQICKSVTFIHMNTVPLAPSSALSTFSSTVVTKK